MDKIIVVKMGGSAFDSRDTTIEDIVALQQQGHAIVVVHGGGNLVSQWLEQMGIATRFVRGERVTDRKVLDVVCAVLAGLANKEIVAGINCAGGRAIGLSGADGALIQGRIKSKELGYVAEVTDIDTGLLRTLLEAGYIPVLSPLTLHSGRAGDDPPLLNSNGDHVAGEIAAALGAGKLVFLTDVDGIRDRAGTLLGQLSADEAEALIGSGVASGGMIPKIRACLRALTVDAVTRIINGTQPHALLREIEGQGNGTIISK